MSGNTTTLVVAVVALLGTVATAILAPVLSGRAARLRADAEARQSQRAEVKSAIATFLESAQHLQTQLYAREHDREHEDVKIVMEQIWLAHAQVYILCSPELRDPIWQYAAALNDVSRHPDGHRDWWGFVGPKKLAVLDAIWEELRLPELALSGGSPQGSAV